MWTRIVRGAQRHVFENSSAVRPFLPTIGGIACGRYFDNAAAKNKRGRVPPMSETEINEAIALRAKDISVAQISSILGRSQGTIRFRLLQKATVAPEKIGLRKGRPLTPSEKAEMTALRAKGLRDAEIAAKLGRSLTAVTNHFRLNASNMSHQNKNDSSRRLSQVERDDVLAMRAQGHSAAETARRLGCSQKVVEARLHAIDEGIEHVKRRPWGTDELLLVYLLRACKLSLKEIAKILGRKHDSVYKASRCSNFKSISCCPSELSERDVASMISLTKSNATIDGLLEQISQGSRPALELWLHETREVLEQRKLRAKQKRPWTENEVASLQPLYDEGRTWQEVADLLGRSEMHVIDKVCNLRRTQLLK